MTKYRWRVLHCSSGSFDYDEAVGATVHFQAGRQPLTDWLENPQQVKQMVALLTADHALSDSIVVERQMMVEGFGWVNG